MTPHFTLSECESHALCLRHVYPIVDNRLPRIKSPTTQIATIAEWRAGCEILEQARAKLGHSITVSCGYRSPRLNQLAGGAMHSQHMGYRRLDVRVVQSVAFDLQVPTEPLLDHLYAILQTLPHDQLIMEDRRQGRDWIHWSWNPYAPNRAQAFTLNV